MRPSDEALAEAELHEEGCGCAECAWLDAHYCARQQAREAATYGGLSQRGLELLGWVEGEKSCA